MYMYHKQPLEVSLSKFWAIFLHYALHLYMFPHVLSRLTGEDVGEQVRLVARQRLQRVHCQPGRQHQNQEHHRENHL